MRARMKRVLLLFTLLAVAKIGVAETGTVTASALVLREAPSLASAMLGEIPNDADLELIAYDDGWYWVQYGMQKGFVSARYVRVELPEGVTTAPPLPAEIEALPAGTPPPGVSLPQLVFDEENNPNYPRILKPGDMGNSVIDLQVTLRQMGYPTATDGQFGYETQAALMKLQRAMGIDADGVVGPQTRRLIGNGNGSAGSMELLDWWQGGNVAYARLTEASVVDARTGKRFRISRYGGDNHCDVEPLTAQDTQAFLSILGGEWTWERRPAWLEANGRVIAVSINCMPHEGQHIWGNEFDGHFCMHFLNSRTHETDRVDEEHAACVREAWEIRGRYVP